MDRPSDRIRVADVSDELDVDVVESLVLSRDALRQDVVDEPGQVDILLVLPLFARLGLALLGLPGGALLLRLRDDQLLDRLQVLLEVVLSSVVTLELDLVDDVLSRLLQAQVFDEVLKPEAVLLVGLGLLDLLVDHLLPGYVARVGSVHLLLHGVETAEEGWVEVARAEALRLDIDWHVLGAHWLLLNLSPLGQDLGWDLTVHGL